MKQAQDFIDWNRINNDVNGNPRYVCHYLNFKPLNHEGSFSYEDALFIARKLGGRKFHNRQYGGGVVFQSYNIGQTTERILIETGDAIKCNRSPNAYEVKHGHGATHYRAFLRKEILNRDGNLKKWFKCPIDGLNYSTK